MNTVKFIKERRRMCETYMNARCFGGPANDHDLCKFNVFTGDEAEKQVELVEKWSKENPIKTR